TPSPRQHYSTPSATTRRASTPRASPPPPASIASPLPRRWRMVDLAKIRKKKAEGRKQKAEVVSEPAPVVAQQPSNLATEQPRNAEKLERFMADAGKKREGFEIGRA